MSVEVVYIPLCDIQPGHNPRKRFDEARLIELGESIRARGVEQPIRLRETASAAEKKFQIVFGERRFRAAAERLAHLAAIAFVSVALVVLALFLDDPEPRQAFAPARAEACK